jgi:hypothetical protein
MYEKLGGMTGTAETEPRIYEVIKLDVLVFYEQPSGDRSSDMILRPGGEIPAVKMKLWR